MQTEINEFQQTFWIRDGGAYVNGYLQDGEIFFITVPTNRRRQGVAKKLLNAAADLLKQYGHTGLKFTSATTPEGRALIAWWHRTHDG